MSSNNMNISVTYRTIGRKLSASDSLDYYFLCSAPAKDKTKKYCLSMISGMKLSLKIKNTRKNSQNTMLCEDNMIIKTKRFIKK